MSVDARDWALRYAELGWRVFPVVAGGKKPIYAGWQRDATTDADLIVRWWRRQPAPNIGLICGEAFVAFDIEVDHLAAVSAWVRREDHELRSTPVARTGRGGIHILTRPFGDGGKALRLEGVRIGELKGLGGFIVACPSRTEGAYSWLRGPDDVPISEAPGWLRARAAERSTMETTPADRGPVAPARAMALAASLFRVVATAREGERNATLFWAACRAAEHALEASAIASILEEAAHRAGLPGPEARATIRSGLSR